MNPYLIEGPAVISFSGGRTSGYMLAKIVEAHGGKLPDDVIPIFANTGKEHEKTLEFVQACSERIAPVTWIEYGGKDSEGKKTHRIVDFAAASRNGEPFVRAINDMKIPPNPVARFCTAELKIRPIIEYLRGLGWESWGCAVGIRADEPRRVAKLRAGTSGVTKDQVSFAPLADAGATKNDVLAFWDAMPFELDLPIAPDGDTWAGNCDLCFLKSIGKKVSLIRAEPQRAEWWAQQEESTGNLFRIDQPSYRQMIHIATQPTLNFESEDIADCACTD